MGIVVQFVMLAALTALRIDYLAATALAVESAVIHNFLWHCRYTWRDSHGLGRIALLAIAISVSREQWICVACGESNCDAAAGWQVRNAVAQRQRREHLDVFFRELSGRRSLGVSLLMGG
jgi:hypothetical protein